MGIFIILWMWAVKPYA